MDNLTIEKLAQNGASANDGIDLGSLKYTSRLIVERALSRGWQIAHFPEEPSVLFVQIPGRQSLVRIFSASPPSTTYPSVKIAKNKSLTSSILASAELPILPEVTIAEREIAAAKGKINTFLKEHRVVVVKPLDASHGYGVRTNINDLEGVIEAANEAASHSTSDKIVIQKQYDGQDVRMLCINHKFVNAITRIPARIFGDGTHTIEQLITLENKSSTRGENYKTKLNIIDVRKVQQYLGSDINRIPAINEEVQVVGISNIGAGGERRNITGDIPDWMKAMAESVSRVLELPVIGIDFLVKEVPKEYLTIEKLQPIVLEVNECPMLTMYDDLHSSEQSKLIDKYLDYLEK